MISRRILLPTVVLAVACAGRPARPPLVAQPSITHAAAGGLVTEDDRRRLTAIAAERGPGVAHGGDRIGPDDLLDVRIPDLMPSPSGSIAPPGDGSPALPVVTAEPVYQQGIRVSPQGDITLPLLGTVHAAGQTPTELANDIARRLIAAGLLRRPQVSVQVAEHRSQVVAVVGSVERPGLYPLTRPGATLADLIWAAGGPTKDAGRVVAFVPVDAGQTVNDAAAPAAAVHAEPVRVDLQALLHAEDADGRLMNPFVRPGDLINVAPAGTVQVAGWVDKPGSYPVTRGLTLSGAVAAAGGQLFPADLHHVALKRQLDPGDARQLTIDLAGIARGETPDLPITDGDVVTVPASAPRMVPYGAWQAVRELLRVGGTVALF